MTIPQSALRTGRTAFYAAASSAPRKLKNFPAAGRNPLRGKRLLSLTAPFAQGSLGRRDYLICTRKSSLSNTFQAPAPHLRGAFLCPFPGRIHEFFHLFTVHSSLF